MYQTKDLFQVQSELVDAKVEIAVSKASDRIIECIENRIENLGAEVHALKDDMNEKFHSLKDDMNEKFHVLRHDMNDRLTAVETRLRMRNETRDPIRSRLIEFAFKAGLLALAAIVSATVSGVVLYLHHL
jgi:predicted methyltransferase